METIVKVIPGFVIQTYTDGVCTEQHFEGKYAEVTFEDAYANQLDKREEFLNLNHTPFLEEVEYEEDNV